MRERIVSGRHELTRLVGASRLAGFDLDRFVRWWALCWPNRVADDAGRYRRLALGLALVPWPLAVYGAAVAANAPEHAVHGLVALVVGLCCGWLAVDLVRSASMVTRRARPHPSAVALGLSLVLLIVSCPVTILPADRPGPALVRGPGLAVLIVGALILAGADRVDEQTFGQIGRMVVVVGLLLVGAAELGSPIVGSDGPISSTGRLAISAILLVTAYFEARVLLRAWALSRALAGR